MGSSWGCLSGTVNCNASFACKSNFSNNKHLLVDPCFFSRFNMPHTPLSRLRPQKFPKIGDEEEAYDSDNEDSDSDSEPEPEPKPEPEPEPEQAVEAIPTEDEENEHEETTLISNESLHCCRIN